METKTELKEDELHLLGGQKHTTTEMVELLCLLYLQMVTASMLTVTTLMLVIYYRYASVIHFVVVLPPSGQKSIHANNIKTVA